MRENDNFIKLAKELNLYQKDSNLLWYTDENVFCDYSKKQIRNGVLIKTSEEGEITICEIRHYVKKVMHQLFSKYEFIYLRGIYSEAIPVKRIGKKAARSERNKMTLNLRYKILKRDKFRCNACGALAGDVELQIDHVIPVSKGGKTVEENLQVLCKICNIGKSNKQ